MKFTFLDWSDKDNQKKLKYIFYNSTVPLLAVLLYNLVYLFRYPFKWDKKYLTSLRRTLVNLLVLYHLALFLSWPYVKDNYKEKTDWKKLPVQFTVATFVLSLIYGYMHKLAHHPKYFKAIHSEHHKYFDVEPIAAYDVSKLEFIFAYLFSSIVSSYIMSFNSMRAASSFITFTLLMTVYIHIPKPYRFDVLRFWPFYSNKFHMIHHKRITSNFSAPWFALPDIIAGTYKAE